MRARIEIPKGSFYKYEVDKETGDLVVDRPLPEQIPYNYGYIENTLYKDGDPLDVCVITAFPIEALALVRVVPIGIFICNDNGDQDDKIVAVVEGDSGLPDRIEYALEQIKWYLASYKPGFKVLSYEGPEEALKIWDWSVQNAKASRN